MCRHLIEIPNPYFNRKAYAQEKGSLVTINKNLVPSTETIKVPCGKCSECKARKISEYVQRGLVESMTSYVYFITLTYDNEHLQFLELDGEKFFYADYDDIQNCFKRFRAANHIDREFRYMTVNEYGDKKHRPHFHVLLFVSKLEGDTKETPHFLREIIFSNLGNYFSKNVGTRKHPKYEKLFTYQERIDSFGKRRTNYFVTYVEPNEFTNILHYDSIQDINYLKAIRYCCGYMNKPSKYEQKVEIFIEKYRDTDYNLYLKLRHLLKSQVRVSKGFGCGFNTDGTKFYLDRISVRCSSNTHVYTEIVDSLPKSYEEFVRMYPSFNEEILEWRERDFYRHFSSWERCKNAMTADEYMYHCVYFRYFSEEFNKKYNIIKGTRKRELYTFFDKHAGVYKTINIIKNERLQPTISTMFKLLHDNSKYSPMKVHTSQICNSRLYNYLRGMVDESIEKGLPCICFKMVGSQTYVPMCKYYKDRVCTLDDTYALYEKLGVKNYEQWMQLFENTIKNNNKQIIQNGNEFKYYNDDEVDILKVQDLDDGITQYIKIFS